MMEKIQVSIYIILAGKGLNMIPKAEINGSFDYIKVKKQNIKK